MNLKYFLFGLLLIISLAIPVNALSCSDTNKAKQYALDGESVEYWGYATVDNSNSCIFKFNNRNPSLSEIIIIDMNGERVSNQTSNIQPAIFSYFTANYIMDNFQKIDPTLQDIDNSLGTDASKYNSKLDPIRDAGLFIIDYIRIKPLKIGKYLEIDFSQPLKNFVFEHSNPKWEDIIKQFRSFRANVDQVKRSKEKGFTSFDNDVKPMFESMASIQEVMKRVDEKTGSNLTEKFGALNSEQLANNIAQQSTNEANNIELRVNKKKEESTNEATNVNLKVNELNNLIWMALEKDIDTTKFEETFCRYRNYKNNMDLIEKERFQDSIDDSKNTQKDIQQNINELNADKSSNKFALSMPFSKLRWWLKITFSC
ncbi:MAG: hypothetical protein ABIF85_06205 [Nanoarchaeota archaeon]